TMSVIGVTKPTPGYRSDLPASSGAISSDVSFSPTGGMFTFRVRGGAHDALYVADLRGAPASRLIDAAGARGDQPTAGASAPDGTRFAYARETGTNTFEYDIWIADETGATDGLQSISHGPCRPDRVWSPDASQLVFAAADGHTLFVFDGAATR